MAAQSRMMSPVTARALRRRLRCFIGRRQLGPPLGGFGVVAFARLGGVPGGVETDDLHQCVLSSLRRSPCVGLHVLIGIDQERLGFVECLLHSKGRPGDARYGEGRSEGLEEVTARFYSLVECSASTIG